VHRGQLWGRARGSAGGGQCDGEAWTLFAQPKPQELDLIQYCTALCCLVFPKQGLFRLGCPFRKG